MKKRKIWMIVASIFLLFGVAVFVTVMSINGWDFTKLSTVQYEENVHEITQEFDSVSLHTDTSDVKVLLASDNKCKVVCYEEEKLTHAVGVVDGTLVINETNRKEWTDYIGLSFEKTQVTVYLPQTAYTTLGIKASTSDVEIAKDFTFQSVDIEVSTGDVKCLASVSGALKITTSTGDVKVEGATAGGLDVTTSTGDIRVKDVSCENLSVVVSTGDATLENVRCENLVSRGSTGEMEMSNVIATGKMSIQRDTGDVEFVACDAAEIWIKTNTGDVEGSLLSPKTFVTDSGTGDVRVPQLGAGGRCEIKTSTGDIEISIR